MASHLARAARKLCSGGGRGLSDVLSEASTSGRQLQTPWMVTALRAHGGAADAAGASSGSSGGDAPSTTQPQLAVEEAGASSSTAAAAAAAAAAATLRVRPPPGHTDFQQRQLLMFFTCNKCNTRAAKAFSKQSYEGGVVIVECPGCQSRHLIADHLGWFGQKGTVEEFAAERGATVVRKLADGTVELSPEDLLGASLAGEAAAVQAAGGVSGGGADTLASGGALGGGGA
ncbi:zinc finger domain-containing [Micractinium conductrix]|uniref:Zinc finger domain-containing n=1 Tax=Micractinium conductrix TaxID=554055 RepID=A0A2P6VAB1_9CHLO|nr:zinc finger domain-containing [Micractinium conductrix]|eukprot:PSC70991.1 zinc finger domain-containing [Micractinium conductrix]